ncbi:MAG: DNA mismatch repair protein MutS [Bacteroidales bacterium]
MIFSSFAKRIDGLQYLADKMELSGSRVRRYLLKTPFVYRAEELERQFGHIEKAVTILENVANAPKVMQLRHLLASVHDIKGTLEGLKNNRVLDEIELFELKHFASLCKDIRLLCEGFGIMDFAPSCLRDVFDLLDPDKTGRSGFYLYDSYSSALAAARKEASAAKAEENPEGWQEAAERMQKEEWRVREMLSDALSRMHAGLQSNFDNLAYLEIIFAKAALAKRYGMVRPRIIPLKGAGGTDGALWVRNMVNPVLADVLQAQGLAFQPVSVTLHKGPCLLTGANMSGKTVVLKTLALIQALTQFAFFVPAEEAVIPLVKDVFLVLGDKQDHSRGLSSFAAEMLELNEIMGIVKKGTPVLLLADEPARTTNPAEGAAILCATVVFMEQYGVRSLISTHYGDLDLRVRKLRVAGFEGDRVTGLLKPSTINTYMNYSLLEDTGGSVPKEALLIARLLGVDASFIDLAQDFLKKKDDERIKTGT